MYGPDGSFPTGTLAGFNNCIQPDRSWYRIMSVPVLTVAQWKTIRCPVHYTQSDNQCVNFTTATITQTCTDGVPQIRPLGANSQPPSIWTNLTKKSSTQDYEVSVKILCGQVLPNADVTLNYSAAPYSGGHTHHDTNRPNGKFDLTAISYTSEPNGTTPLTVNTGSSGTLTVKYTAPQSSGQTRVTMTCTLPDGSTCASRETIIDVGVQGLLRMGVGG